MGVGGELWKLRNLLGTFIRFIFIPPDCMCTWFALRTIALCSFNARAAVEFLAEMLKKLWVEIWHEYLLAFLSCFFFTNTSAYHYIFLHSFIYRKPSSKEIGSISALHTATQLYEEMTCDWLLWKRKTFLFWFCDYVTYISSLCISVLSKPYIISVHAIYITFISIFVCLPTILSKMEYKIAWAQCYGWSWAITSWCTWA